MARYIASELKDSIQLGNDIVEVISSYLPLKRAGRNFKALCPFHSEKTPSFSVNPEKQIFHCFGCGAGGDVFSFIMLQEHLIFPEALAFLARRAGIEIPESRPGASSRKETLLKIHALALEYFRWALLESSSGQRARDYLAGRKIKPETIEKFKLGYAPRSWDGLLRFAARRGQETGLLVEAGLAIPRPRGDGFYDRFRERLIFPVFDIQGRVIAFGGRVLDDSQPKYINSPDTPLFEKGRVLYGLHLAKDAVAKEGEAILGEGYFDVIRAHQEGVQNMVCSQGTAFTPQQAQLMKRYTERIVTVYDADAAGEEAVLRGLSVFLEKNFEVKVALLPAGDDPDSFIARSGREEFIRVLNGSSTLLDFKLETLFKRYDPATDLGRIEITRRMLEAISWLESPVLRDGYLLKLAQRLGVSPAAVREEYGKTSRKQFAPSPKVESPPAKVKAEKWLLRSILTDGNIFDKTVGFIDPADFSSPLEEIARKIIQLRERNKLPVSRYLLGELTEEKTKSLAASLMVEASASPPSLAETVDLLVCVRRNGLRHRLGLLADRIALAERKGEDIIDYQKRNLQLRRELESFSADLRRRICSE